MFVCVNIYLEISEKKRKDQSEEHVTNFAESLFLRTKYFLMSKSAIF